MIWTYRISGALPVWLSKGLLGFLSVEEEAVDLIALGFADLGGEG